MKCKLGDICDITSSKRIFAHEYRTFGVPFFRGKEIIEKQDGKPVSNELFIEESRYAEIRDKHGVPHNGDLLLTSVGTLGVPYIVQDERFYFKDGNITWFRNFRNVSSQFIYYWLLSPFGRQQIDSKSIGSTQKALTIDALLGFDIDLPPLAEQRAIADTLSALDDKIANNNKINHHLEQIAQAVFKSWFVDFEPWGGEKPITWITGKAEDFFDISIGKTPPRKEPQWFTTNPQDVIWVSISDMGSCGVFISNSSEYLTAESVMKFNVKVIPSGTVLLSFKLTVGRVAITNGEMTSNEAIAHFKRSEDTTTEYLYCYLKAFDYQSLGNTSSIATAVNSKTIKSMPFVMPDEKVLQDFHATTAPLFKQIKVNLEENTCLATIRDILLPRLMSGALSVSNIGGER